MGLMLMCPCGEEIVARDEEFADTVNGHLAERHDGRTYPVDMILSMATPYPDDKIPS